MSATVLEESLKQVLRDREILESGFTNPESEATNPESEATNPESEVTNLDPAGLKQMVDEHISTPDIVYLPRGNVKVWFELDIALDRAVCLDSKNDEVEPCDLSRVVRLLPEHEMARQIKVTVNPYFSYHKETLDEHFTHGWEIIKGETEIPNLDVLQGLRILAHEELRNIALEHGILAHADASLNRTIERMIELFFDRTVEVVSAETDTSDVPDAIMIGTCVDKETSSSPTGLPTDLSDRRDQPPVLNPNPMRFFEGSG
jgi:hypothetical protein